MFWVRRSPTGGEAEELERADQVRGVADQGHPSLVGVEVGEREPEQPGVFEAADVVLDMGVGSHVHVGVDWSYPG